MRTLFIALVLLGLVTGAGGWYWYAHSKPTVGYRTEPVKHGDLLATISATGTVEPEEVVDVGAQVEGIIMSFGKDANGNLVDYRSPVNEGTLLAQIDYSVYKADRDTAQAALEQANANLLKANADSAQADAKLYQAKQAWERAQKMGPGEALAQNDYDTDKANYDTAVANLAVAKSEIAQAKAGITQSKAALDKAQRNLDFCKIISPVKGVIIDRRVNIGQTVVSSLNAPSLFLIAKDLTKMQVWVAVNEADIGFISPKQNVTFTCDGVPGKVFRGTVGKTRLNATMTQNVVTYTVEVNADNPDLTLLPYLTANVQFELQNHPNVLLVPNAALRWYPTEVQQVAPDVRTTFKPPTYEQHDDASAEKKPATPLKAQKKPKLRSGTIWVKDQQFVRPLIVKVGPTDGINTEIQGDNLSEGTEVIVGEVVQQAGGDETKNPFLPQMRRR